MSHERTERQRTIVLAALVTVVSLTLGACRGPGSPAGSPSPIAAPASTVVPTPTQVSTPSTASPTQVSTVPAAGATPTVITGYIQEIEPTGDFVIEDGGVRYTVVMSPATSVVNLRGRAASRLFLRTSGAVTVSGALNGSTISAESVLIPTRKEYPDG